MRVSVHSRRYVIMAKFIGIGIIACAFVLFGAWIRLIVLIMDGKGSV